MELKQIIKQLKDKPDFNSIELSTKTAYIYIKKIKIFFEKQNKYNLIIEKLKTNKRQTYFNITQAQLLTKLKKYKILQWSI